MAGEGTTSRGRTFPIPLDRRAGRSLRVQLEDELRAAVRDGRLPAGAPLPSSRSLAADLGVSRGVVVEAYDQLLAEGYLVARRGSGTSVADVPAGAAPAPRPTVPNPAPAVLDLWPGTPDLTRFPRARWATAVRRAVTEVPAHRLGYGDPRGAPELRAALAEYLGRVRGVRADPSRIVVCSGWAQGLSLLLRVLAGGAAGSVALEDPGAPEPRRLVRLAGLCPVPLGVDARGARAGQLGDAAAAVLTPAHQFPLGAVLAPERRQAALGWAARTGGVLVEDDYDAEFRYDRGPVGALQGLDPGRVVYSGSASKTLAPALRLGWLVLPASLVDPVAEAKRDDDLGSPTLDQLAFADLLAAGDYDRHLRAARRHYRHRRDRLIAALGTVPGVRVTGAAAGLHLVATLPPGTDEDAVVAAGTAAGVRLAGLTRYRWETPAPPALVLGYGGLPDHAVTATLHRLTALLRDYVPKLRK